MPFTVLHDKPEGSTELFLPGSFPVFIWEPDDGNTFSCFPLLTGERGVKSVVFRPGGVPCTPETLDRQVRGEEIDFMREYLDEYVPSLAGRCLEAVVCMYTNTPDEHFVIDLYPEHAQVSFASPCSGMATNSPAWWPRSLPTSRMTAPLATPSRCSLHAAS